MKTKLSLSLLFVALAYLTLLPGCTGIVPTPSTPPTFLLAWSGADNRVHTMQSTDGSTWVLPAVAPGPTSTTGVAVAHDGAVGWMVLWNSGGTLNYTTGVGGLPSTNASVGITWQTTNATTLRTTPASMTPALAYGNKKWVAVYLGPSGALKIVRSILDSSAIADADADLGITSAGFSPALAFGAGKFVLAYLDGNRNLVARTSPDGVSWSQSTTVFSITPIGDGTSCISPTSVTLSFAEGTFYGVGRQSTTLCAGGTLAGGSSIVVYRSSDGTSWTTLVDRQSGPTVVRDEAGIPGAAFAQCHLVVAYTQTRVGTSPVPNHLVTQIGQPSPCSNPASITFGAPQTISTAPTAKLDTNMAVVFGRGPG